MWTDPRVLSVWCTGGGGGGGASAPTQQLSTSHVQTSSPADAYHTGLANRSVVGDRAQLQASVSVREIFVSKS